MADSTYLGLTLNTFADAGGGINAALANAGLDPLTDWFAGDPETIRESGTPYAWYRFGFRGHDSREGELGRVASFAEPMLVVLALAAPSPAALMVKAAAYIPQLAAALENASAFYDIVLTGWETIGESDHSGKFGLFALEFEVRGERTRGGVS